MPQTLKCFVWRTNIYSNIFHSDGAAIQSIKDVDRVHGGGPRGAEIHSEPAERGVVAVEDASLTEITIGVAIHAVAGGNARVDGRCGRRPVNDCTQDN